MKKIIGGLVIAIAICAARAGVLSPTTVRAEPLAQATTLPTIRPTDEPTKPPYVFPTPIFIPTFPPDTAVPTATRVTPQLGATSYIVQSGDSPWTIERKVYGDPTKYTLIMQANGLIDAARLRIGQVLIIPPLTPFPTLTPTPLPTLTPTPSRAPSPTVTSLVTPTRAPTPASTALDIGSTALVVASGLCLIVLVIGGALLLIGYRRRQQFALPRARPLTPRAAIPPPLPPERLK